MKALILIADGFEDLQVYYPWFRLREEGISVTLASPNGESCTGLHEYVIDADLPIAEVNPNDYDLLFIPGGNAPEQLRLCEEAVAVVRTFMEQEIRVATICHGPQLLLSAGSLNGRVVTCVRGIRDDVRAAGAEYRDEAVVLDGNLITGRSTDDLPRFLHVLVHNLGQFAIS